MPKLKRGRGISQRSLYRFAKKARICQSQYTTLYQKKNAEKVKTSNRARRKKWRTDNKEEDNLLRDERRFNSQVPHNE